MRTLWPAFSALAIDLSALHAEQLRHSAALGAIRRGLMAVVPKATAWVAFFLEGVATAASDAERSIISVASLISADRRRLLQAPKAGAASYRLFELLPMRPRFTIERVRRSLDTRSPVGPSELRSSMLY